MAMLKEQQMAMLTRAAAMQERITKGVKASVNLEKAIRSIISSFALAVGLAWEGAFVVAMGTLVDAVPLPIIQQHLFIAQAVIAFVSFVLMLPVWLKHVSPKARMSVMAHGAVIDAESSAKRPSAAASLRRMLAGGAFPPMLPA